MKGIDNVKGIYSIRSLKHKMHKMHQVAKMTQFVLTLSWFASLALKTNLQSKAGKALKSFVKTMEKTRHSLFSLIKQ